MPRPTGHGVRSPVACDAVQDGPLQRSQPNKTKKMVLARPFGLALRVFCALPSSLPTYGAVISLLLYEPIPVCDAKPDHLTVPLLAHGDERAQTPDRPLNEVNVLHCAQLTVPEANKLPHPAPEGIL